MTAPRRVRRREARARAGAPPRRPRPRRPPPPFRVGRPDLAAFAAAVLGPLALYAATMPRTVVLEDDGLFLMAGSLLGVGHPPGYPVYTLIVHLFTRLPFGDPAVLGHLSSAVLGALACGTLFACARVLAASRIPALAAAWLFGVSEQFWSQAIITDVYTFNALLFFAVYALVLWAVRDRRYGRPLTAAAVLWGVALANHWPLTVLATPGLVVALAPAWRAVMPRLPALLGGAFAAAALPYAWMAWLSNQGPVINFLGPIDSWGDLWHFVSRQIYADVDASPSAGWGDRTRFMGWLAADLARQATPPGTAIAGLGLWAMARRAPVAASGALAMLGNSVVLIGLLGFDFEPMRLAVFRPYALICYGVVALWAAVGLQWAMARAAARGWPAAAPAALLGAAMVAWSGAAGWHVNDRSRADSAERHADVVFDLLPPDAVLFVAEDIAFPVAYLNAVKGRRADVTIYNHDGLLFGNRLFDPRATPEGARRRARVGFMRDVGKPVFLWPSISRAGLAVENHGFLNEVLDGAAAGTVNLTYNDRAARYFAELLDRRPVGIWERALRYSLLVRYGTYLGLAALSGSPVLLDPLAPLLERAEGCYPCLLSMADVLLDNRAVGHADRVAGWLDRAETLRGEALTKRESARVFYEQGRLAELTGDPDRAAARYRRAFAIYPHPDRDAGRALRRLDSAGVPGVRVSPSD